MRSFSRGKRVVLFATLALSVNGACSGPRWGKIETDSLPGGVVGTPYAQTLHATGAGGYRWSLADGALPSGLALDARTGTIAGTPIAAGTSEFSVRVGSSGESDPAAPARAGATRALAITIEWPPLVIADTPLPDGMAGVQYRSPLGASGGDGRYRWSVSSGALPLGLSLDTLTGVLGGRPLAAGRFDFTVRAASAGQEATKPLSLALAFPPSNEPTGYVKQSERSFAAVLEDGWFSEDDGSGVTLTADAGAPESPPSVLRITYPKGFRGGNANARIDLATSVYPSVFVAVWVKWSSNWQGEPSATNKLLFNWIHGNPAVFLSVEGVGSAALVPTMRLQNTPDTREYLRPNVARGMVVRRGQWRRWEYQLVANTPGRSNGVVRWWVDGVLVGEYTDVQLAGAGESNLWEYVSINPTWGGTTGTVSADMYIDLDHIYVSGAP